MVINPQANLHLTPPHVEATERPQKTKRIRAAQRIAASSVVICDNQRSPTFVPIMAPGKPAKVSRAPVDFH
jgi:hypothetical protein